MSEKPTEAQNDKRKASDAALSARKLRDRRSMEILQAGETQNTHQPPAPPQDGKGAEEGDGTEQQQEQRTPETGHGPPGEAGEDGLTASSGTIDPQTEQTPDATQTPPAETIGEPRSPNAIARLIGEPYQPTSAAQRGHELAQKIHRQVPSDTENTAGEMMDDMERYREGEMLMRQDGDTLMGRASCRYLRCRMVGGRHEVGCPGFEEEGEK